MTRVERGDVEGHPLGREVALEIENVCGDMYRLYCEQMVARERGEVFAFFSCPENLAAITPPWLGFQLLTPAPVPMSRGTLIDYRIRLLRRRLRWTTYIAAYEPPEMFVDVQLRGPYSFWYHRHYFEAVSAGTRVIDEVRYLLPLGVVGRWVHEFWVRRQLERIFLFRRARIAELFRAAHVVVDSPMVVGDARGNVTCGSPS